MDKWDVFGMRLAWEASRQSKDPSTQVGAYISDKLHLPVSFGFNGFPRGIADDERLYDRVIKYKIIIHAEVNAILNTTRELNNCTIYTYPFQPCSQCASFLIQKGISRVVWPVSDIKRWIDDFTIAQDLLNEAGVAIVILSPEQIAAILPPQI